MSLSKSESARINGAKSRGPKTPEGKAKSSQNAIKHGIFARVVVLTSRNDRGRWVRRRSAGLRCGLGPLPNEDAVGSVVIVCPSIWSQRERVYGMYDLHSLGWHSFQQLCLTITREILGQTVECFLDTADGGRDGAFAGTWGPKSAEALTGRFVVQCKFTQTPKEPQGGGSSRRIQKSQKARQIGTLRQLHPDHQCPAFPIRLPKRSRRCSAKPG